MALSNGLSLAGTTSGGQSLLVSVGGSGFLNPASMMGHVIMFQAKPDKQLLSSVTGKIISIHHEFEGGIEKSVPWITNWHHEACRAMTIGDREGRIFYPTLTLMMDTFSCSPQNISFYITKA